MLYRAGRPAADLSTESTGEIKFHLGDPPYIENSGAGTTQKMNRNPLNQAVIRAYAAITAMPECIARLTKHSRQEKHYENNKI